MLVFQHYFSTCIAIKMKKKIILQLKFSKMHLLKNSSIFFIKTKFVSILNLNESIWNQIKFYCKLVCH